MLKRSLFILFAMFLLGNPIMAQLKIGLTGGVVLSSLVRDSNIALNDGTVGFLIGGNAKLTLGDLGWYVQSGVNYTNEGDSQQPLSFVKVPLIIGLDAGDDVSIYFAYNLAWQVGNENNVQDFYNDFANIMGLGVEIHISKKFSIGSTLNYGLSNLVSEPSQALNFNIKPLTFDIYVTYRLN